MIPKNKQDAVKRALKSTFGVTSFEDIKILTRGQPTI